MPTLTDILNGDPQKKVAVVDDCCRLIDEEVADRGGLTGMAIKAGYKVVQGVKPGFVRHVMSDLLPEFAAALDPVYQEAKAKGVGVSAHFNANPGRVADGLLGITDEKARHAKNPGVKVAYEKLRGVAKKNVEQAVPRLGRLIEKHAA